MIPGNTEVPWWHHQVDPALVARLADVETHPDHWWESAQYYPLEAMASPLFGLMLLESPERWQGMESLWIGSWIFDYAHRLSPPAMESLAADCVDHGIPKTGYVYSEAEMSPIREALAARRCTPFQKNTEGLWKRKIDFDRILGGAVDPLSLVARREHGYDAIIAILDLMSDLSWWEEVRWQWHRIQYYCETEGVSCYPMQPILSVKDTHS